MAISKKRHLITNIDRLPEKIELKTTPIRRVNRKDPEIKMDADGSSSSLYIDGKRTHHIFKLNLSNLFSSVRKA
jgi:hypothetical protein